MVHADMSPDGGIMLLLRPHLGEFLQRANALFDELIVFTAATQEYADRALEHVEQVSGVRLRRRYYRDSCSINAYGEVAKDLRILREDAGTVAFLLDNTPSAYSLQPEAGIAIKSYVRDDPTDVALLDTLDAIGASRMSGAGSRHGFTFEAVLRERGWWVAASKTADHTLTHVFLDGGSASVCTSAEAQAALAAAYVHDAARNVPLHVVERTIRGGSYRMFADFDVALLADTGFPELHPVRDIKRIVEYAIDHLPPELRRGSIVVCLRESHASARLPTKLGAHLIWSDELRVDDAIAARLRDAWVASSLCVVAGRRHNSNRIYFCAVRRGHTWSLRQLCHSAHCADKYADLGVLRPTVRRMYAPSTELGAGSERCKHPAEDEGEATDEAFRALLTRFTATTYANGRALGEDAVDNELRARTWYVTDRFERQADIAAPQYPTVSATLHVARRCGASNWSIVRMTGREYSATTGREIYDGEPVVQHEGALLMGRPAWERYLRTGALPSNVTDVRPLSLSSLITDTNTALVVPSSADVFAMSPPGALDVMRALRPGATNARSVLEAAGGSAWRMSYFVGDRVLLDAEIAKNVAKRGAQVARKSRNTDVAVAVSQVGVSPVAADMLAAAGGTVAGTTSRKWIPKAWVPRPGVSAAEQVRVSASDVEAWRATLSMSSLYHPRPVREAPLSLVASLPESHGASHGASVETVLVVAGDELAHYSPGGRQQPSDLGTAGTITDRNIRSELSDILGRIMSQFVNINDDSPNIRIDSVRALVDAAYHQVLTPPGGEVIRRVYKQQNELKDRRTTDPRLSKMSTAAFNDVLVRLVERNRPQLLAEMATTVAGVLLAMLPDALLSPGPDLQKRCKTTGNAASNGRAKGVKHGVAQLLACAASEGVKQSAVNTNSGTSDADADAASAAPAVSLQAIQAVSQRVTESGAVSGVMVGKMGKMAADVDRPRRIARIDNCLSYIPAIQTGVARSLMFRVLQEKDKVKPELVTMPVTQAAP
ncbi:hypothetical protein FOA52_001625 [Chlamydomonas sp. UWO 241]|nr:hypothetical protein FOA52_001625 [Chlamydomonas sp. UWO 241]